VRSWRREDGGTEGERGESAGKEGNVAIAILLRSFHGDKWRLIRWCMIRAIDMAFSFPKEFQA